MTSRDRFNRQFARLVWLLVYRPGNQDEQKKALRGVLEALKDGDGRIGQSDLSTAVALSVKKALLSEDLAWMTELANRMAVHSVRSVQVLQAATAAQVLAAARLLVLPGRGDGKPRRAFDAAVEKLAEANVMVEMGRDSILRHTPPIGVAIVPSTGASPTPRKGTTPIAFRQVTPVAVPVIRATPTQGTVPPRAATPGKPGLRNSAPQMVVQEIMPSTTASDLVLTLRGPLTLLTVSPLGEGILHYIEDKVRKEDWGRVLEMANHISEREATIENPSVGRTLGLLVRRISTPQVLRGVAGLLHTQKDKREMARDFLNRAGEAGADAIIDLLITAESSSERRAYRDTLRECPAAAPQLARLLQDHRWFVVRNAAELLGAMQVETADRALEEVLTHKDARVRRAAMFALVRLGTPRAINTIRQALRDEEPQMRIKAATGLARSSHATAASSLLDALDSESVLEVQCALLAAMAHHPTKDVLNRLVKETRPGTILRRRPAQRRLAAVQALYDSGTVEGRKAISQLLWDKDKAIRELAEDLLKQLDRKAG